ncbi:hypothetical protein KIPB_008113 [Kipferlia bialata]|uniref:Uncharacterized protein n=1 Tax=Kipferlia bialata TaxID=797122 RepID=A0A9K3GH00_9EUKA|nr:hypothetical protein KIPB_003855 [Kipferlia bialata]GIQ83225.1 hypothetical protein KIPB_004514 [Kipferlia bialata]GIQ86286.1 hypothetical protein KIPB_008113 [Kipferlia bialata]|eukprot:g3855.t1
MTHNPNWVESVAPLTSCILDRLGWGRGVMEHIPISAQMQDYLRRFQPGHLDRNDLLAQYLVALSDLCSVSFTPLWSAIPTQDGEGAVGEGDGRNATTFERLDSLMASIRRATVKADLNHEVSSSDEPTDYEGGISESEDEDSDVPDTKPGRVPLVEDTLAGVSLAASTLCGTITLSLGPDGKKPYRPVGLTLHSPPHTPRMTERYSDAPPLSSLLQPVATALVESVCAALTSQAAGGVLDGRVAAALRMRCMLGVFIACSTVPSTPCAVCGSILRGIPSVGGVACSLVHHTDECLDMGDTSMEDSPEARYASAVLWSNQPDSVSALPLFPTTLLSVHNLPLSVLAVSDARGERGVWVHAECMP